MEKHFVNFLSPGTFVAEHDSREIDSWNVEKAKAIAKEIRQRHGARPYGFYFTTRSRSVSDLDSKTTLTSIMYYIGGKVETLKEVETRNDPSERILLSNMKSNGYDKIIVSTSGNWKWTQPFRDDDVVLENVYDSDGKVT